MVTAKLAEVTVPSVKIDEVSGPEVSYAALPVPPL